MIQRVFRLFKPSQQVEVLPSDSTPESLEAIRGSLERIVQAAEEKPTIPGYTLFNSAIVVAILSGILFMWGYSYYRGFYERLSLLIPISVETPYTYLAASLDIGVIVLLAMVVIAVGPKLTPSAAFDRHTKLRAFIQNLGFFLLYGSAPISLIARGRYYPELILGLVLFTMVLVVSVFSMIFIDLLLHKKYYPLMISLITVMTIVHYVEISEVLGAAQAERLLAGRSNRGSTVVLEMKNSSSPLHGSVYALVQIQGGNYYLVEMASPAPEHPTLHIVPQSEVLSARVERMNGEIPAPVRPVDSPTATPATPAEG